MLSCSPICPKSKQLRRLPYLRTLRPSAIVEASGGSREDKPAYTGRCQMSYRSLALAVTALTSLHATSAISGDLPGGVYVAPGGVYIGAGPVYVVPGPNGNGNGHYVAPSYYDYPAPPVVAP